ncbi:MAG: hypothetical protein GW795_04620 [Cyanobacteria bacterium]|nr:hypothetical protein [Cyanobacteria bacterium CG_2015-16_32_12]NCO79618.1 hypothetical protein [Cyanobacteria bacterium CG_2015-22_32_23]NCQ04599.1 hypothetical protein [Cyanobacteria bacterium CG_2015-09_32_10]NCQ41176.1 hypothetical protein [Cyanobacteria bacterium CG_2015-04_32_10]NCS83381.1 hypothetical protein [Cyanobacteria bacterium CG_2015-02_32_10]
MTKNTTNSQTTINIIGIGSSLLILLMGFFIKSNSLKIIGIITGISTGIYTQLASKKLEQDNEKLTTLPESKTIEISSPCLEIIEEKERDLEIKENVIKYQYLEDEKIIKQTIDQFSKYSTLWLDTETADWDKPTKRLSLLQITANPNDLTGESVYLLDLLDKNHLIEYFIQTIMVNENIQKVFHNAPYDLRFLGGKDRVNNIFCTYNLSRKLSLEVLGTPNRQLKTLASYLCGFTIEENEQGSDWAIRPLTEKQVKYAAMDIIFLTQVHQKLEDIYNLSTLDKNELTVVNSQETINTNPLNFEEELALLLTEQQLRNHQKSWVYYQIRNEFRLDLEKLKIIAQALGYNERWAYYRAGINPPNNQFNQQENNHQNMQNLPSSSDCLNISESAILFRINRTYSPDLSSEELYNITRGNWVLRERRENADYAFAVYRGIIKQVYRIHSWDFSGVITNGNERYCFEGEIAEDKQNYIGMNVAHYFPRGMASSTRYVNC